MRHIEEWNKIRFWNDYNYIPIDSLPIELVNNIKIITLNKSYKTYSGIKYQLIAEYFFPDEVF